MATKVTHDLFYVVSNSRDNRVKLGISSGFGESRLAVLAKEGYETLEFIEMGLPGNLAAKTETRILGRLADQDYSPIKGREYFADEALKTILYLARDFLSNTNIELAGGKHIPLAPGTSPHKYPAFNYRTDPQRLNRARAVANRLGMSLTKALDEAVDSWLERQESEAA